ncbi:MAG: type III pantothenate kinase [Clostridia bacterium]|nr:type III pantothenate kinase [Clostridia bacterium]
MVLVSDIGNSNITIGIYDDEKLIMNARFCTDKKYTIDQFAISYHEIFNIKKINIEQIEGSIISSVVPEITMLVKEAIKIVTKADSLIVGPGIKTGLNILIDNPAELGADLVIASVAIKKKYPLPCICFDLGTATKVLVINKNGEFIGGAIAPGVKVSLNALSSGTSLLPYIGLDIPKKYIGKNTSDCMLSGSVLGTVEMLKGLKSRMSDEISEKFNTTVMTGGISSAKLAEYMNDNVIYDEYLLLDGLKEIYLKNK